MFFGFYLSLDAFYYTFKTMRVYPLNPYTNMYLRMNTNIHVHVTI